MLRPPNILTIAGSDSGGGAGIQADLKTMTMLGAYGMSVITALTAQNGLGVTGIHAPDPAFAALQLQTVLDGFRVDAAKTGMLFSSGIMEALVPALEKKTFHVCVDTPDTKTRVMKTVLYQGNNPRVRNNTLLKEIEWSGFPAVRNYVVKFVIFITLASKDSIVVRVEDRVNKQVYLADTEILI